MHEARIRAEVKHPFRIIKCQFFYEGANSTRDGRTTGVTQSCVIPWIKRGREGGLEALKRLCTS